jgi:hypothetical protein
MVEIPCNLTHKLGSFGYRTNCNEYAIQDPKGKINARAGNK